MGRFYLGLDCSSKGVHGAIINDKGELQETPKWVSKLPNFDDRFLEFLPNFYEEIGIIIDRYNLLCIAIEAPIFIQNPKTTMQIASVVYATKLLCFLRGLDSVLVQNKVWKKYTIGKGIVSKSDILQYANIFWKCQFKEQDWADASCIALWCRFFNTGEEI